MISAGPWHVEFHGPRTTIVCQDQGSQSALAEVFSMRGVGEREANAQLIAAAPDLLAMVEKYASECIGCAGSAEIIFNKRGGDPEWDYALPCPSCKDIWSLISKARGEA